MKKRWRVSLAKCRDGQSGQAALVIVLVLLVVGTLTITPLLGLMGTGLKAGQVHEQRTAGYYAAEAGVEEAVWKLQTEDGPFSGGGTRSLGEPINGMDVDYDVDEEAGDGGTLYTITSTASLEGATKGRVVAQVWVASGGGDGGGPPIPPDEDPPPPVGPDGSSIFDYAVFAMDGNVKLGGSSKVMADQALEGNVYADGNITLTGSAQISGSATATGGISTGGSSHIDGEQTEGAEQCDLSELEQWTANFIVNRKAEAQDVDCPTCGSYTHTETTWSPTAGVYSDREHAKKKMSISGSGTWTFQDTVCVGVDYDKDLDISGSTTVTFEGPVRVGGDLDISGSCTVVFEDTVCVGSDIDLGGSVSVVFQGPLYVGHDFEFSADAVEFRDTAYVDHDMKVTGSTDLLLGGTVYVGHKLKMSGSGIRGGHTVVAEDDVTLTGSAKLAGQDIPFVLSAYGNIRFSGSGWTSAIVYAPDGNIKLTGSNKVHGCLAGNSVTTTGSVQVEYPMDLRSSGDGESPVILSWDTD